MSQTIIYDLGWIRQPNYSAILAKSTALWLGTKPDAESKKQFTELNLGQLTLAVDTYLSILKEIGVPSPHIGSVISLMEKEGLPSYVAYMSRIKVEWAHGKDVWAIHSAISLPRNLFDLCSWMCNNLTPARFNLVCSFLKRFTPTNALAMHAACIKLFRQREHENAVRTFSSNDSFFLAYVLKPRVAAYLRLALQGYREETCEFTTSNAVSNCCEMPSHRYLLANRFEQSLIDWLYSSREGQELAKNMEDIPQLFQRVNFVGPVPKDVKSSRIVMPEDPERLQLQEGIRQGLLSAIARNDLRTNIPLHNQDIMRNLCRLSTGSKPIPYATLDESAASDLITKREFVELVPEMFHLLETLPHYYALRENPKAHSKLYMLAPMGCNVTMPLQSLMFWAVDSAAADIYYWWTGDKRPHRKLTTIDPDSASDAWTDTRVQFRDPFTGEVFDLYPHLIFVMGDDQQVPTAAAETVMDIHDILGWKPNRDKSFFDESQSFRESCGVEFYNGQDVSINYWPRRPLSIKYDPKRKDYVIADDKMRWEHTSERGGGYSNTITCLVGLQHRLVSLDLRDTATALRNWIMARYAKMTMSEEGEPNMDLWGWNLGKDPVPYPLAEQTETKEVEYEYIPLSIRYGITRIKRDDAGNIQYRVVSRWTNWKKVSHDNSLLHFRERHLSVKSKATLVTRSKSSTSPCVICKALQKCKDPDRVQYELSETLRYWGFLKRGPQYESELDKLLMVSSAPRRFDEVAGAYLDYTF